jgi:hypothetical protein
LGINKNVTSLFIDNLENTEVNNALQSPRARLSLRLTINTAYHSGLVQKHDIKILLERVSELYVGQFSGEIEVSCHFAKVIRGFAQNVPAQL